MTTTRQTKRQLIKPEIQVRMETAATLFATIQDLEAQLLEHRKWILEYLKNHNESSIKLGNFNVSLKSRHNWFYSAELAQAMLNIKQLQKDEQDNNIAIDKPTQYVAFTFDRPKG